MNLLNMYQDKIKEIGKENLDRGQKKSKIRSFVTNTLAIIDLIQTYENKNPKKEFHFISREKFNSVVKRDRKLDEAMKYLKERDVVEVFKKNGVEHYIHWTHDSISGLQTPVSKGYKISEHGYEMINNSVEDVSWNKFLDQMKVQQKHYVPLTPEQVLQKYKEEQYYFKYTKKNIERVLNSNLQLEFHPLSDEEMVKIYKQEKNDKTSDEDILFKLSVVKDYFANKEFTYNIRMYSAFTNTPKCWRKFITNSQGKKIVELFDIHSSVLNMLPLICQEQLLQDYNEEQYKQFEQERLQLEKYLKKDVYEYIAGEEYSRQEIKQALMYVLFSNNKSFNTIQKTPKGKVKKLASNRIKIWLNSNFPIMSSVIGNFKQIENKNKKQYWKKTKSTVWMHFQKMQTELMAELNTAISMHYNTKVYNIHDAIFVDEESAKQIKKDDVRIVYERIKQKMRKTIYEKNPIKVEVKPVVVELIQTTPEPKAEETFDMAALTADLEGGWGR